MLEKYNGLKVLQVFFDEPLKEHGIREISNKVGLSAPSVKKWLEELENLGLIRRISTKYIAERENEEFIRLKKIINLWNLYRSGLVDFLAESFPKAIILFGSYRYGVDTEESDIDLLVVANNFSLSDLSKFEKKLKRKINVMVINSLKDLDENLLENILNGIVLFGGIEVDDIGCYKDKA